MGNGKVIAREFLKPGERGPEARTIAGTRKVAAVKAVLRLPHKLG
jgi:hypothetical protein